MTENYIKHCLYLNKRFYPIPRSKYKEVDFHIPLDALQEGYEFNVERQALIECERYEEEKKIRIEQEAELRLQREAKAKANAEAAAAKAAALVREYEELVLVENRSSVREYEELVLENRSSVIPPPPPSSSTATNNHLEQLHQQQQQLLQQQQQLLQQQQQLHQQQQLLPTPNPSAENFANFYFPYTSSQAQSRLKNHDREFS